MVVVEGESGVCLDGGGGNVSKLSLADEGKKGSMTSTMQWSLADPVRNFDKPRSTPARPNPVEDLHAFGGI